MRWQSLFDGGTGYWDSLHSAPAYISHAHARQFSQAFAAISANLNTTARARSPLMA